VNFVIFVNGLVLLFSAALMGVDALFFPETAAAFALSGVLTGFVGMALTLSSNSSFENMHRLHGFLLTSSVWVTAALAGAVPLYMTTLSPVDALFESMSGITTTGSTVMSGLDSTPRGIILWRAILQAVGGVGFIVTGIALLPILKVGGMQLFRTESSDKSEKELSNAAKFASATLMVYLGLMTFCALVYAVGGMSIFDAITHAMTTLSTGGYSGYDASFGHFQSPFLQWSGTFFMLMGGLPFAWYIRAFHRGAFRSEQVIMMLWSLGAVISVLTLWLTLTSGMNVFVAARLVAFNVVSVVTTTGFATTDYLVWGYFAAAVFFALTAVGGCTGSTSGGVKAMRWIMLFRATKSEIARVHSPHSIQTLRYEGRQVQPDVLSGVIAFFVFYVATFSIIAVILAFLGLDLETATSGAITALANVGPGVGSVIGPAGNFASLSAPVKVVLVVAMYLGRLEMLTVFALLTPVFWREVMPAREA
jgi:trk system potassium uptake protein